MTKPILTSLCLLAAGQIFAQTPFCASDELHEQRSASDPQHAKAVEAANRLSITRTEAVAERGTAGFSTDYVIPVVVHVIHPPGQTLGDAPNITDAEVELGLENLNKAFANAAPYTSPKGQKTGISFCLARHDPAGKPTNGIRRVESQLVADPKCGGPSTSIDNEIAIKNTGRWDCNRYLNIWLVSNIYLPSSGNCGIAGFAYYPGTNCSIDGIMMEAEFWKSPGGVIVSAHEAGHYLNLRHTFAGGCNTTLCASTGDFVCDTPPDNSPANAPCDANSCHTEIPDLPDDNGNYLDYGTCKPFHFTPGQVARMVTNLEVNRSGLIANNLCEPLTSLDASVMRVFFKNKNCGERACPSIEVKNNGKSAITSLKIEVKNGLGHIETMALQTGNLPPGGRLTFDLPCLPAVVGLNFFEIKITHVNDQPDEYTPDNQAVLQKVEFLPQPKIALAQLDSALCGLDGKVQVSVSGGTTPYIYGVKLAPPLFQTQPIFEKLPPGLWNFKVEDKNGCPDSMNVAVPDRCPPCLGGVVNHYAAVTEICQNTTLRVDNLLGFAVGQEVLIYQARGAVVNTFENSDFGKIVNLAAAGQYEINRIADLGKNQIRLQFVLGHSYDPGSALQIITVPNLGDADVCNVRAKKWDGKTGGIIAFRGGEITLAGNVDASEAGFQGGFHQCCIATTDCHTDNYAAPPFTGKGGMKGEGISQTLSFAQRACRGAYANGGGGGNDHNAGGGGGGNAGAGGRGGMETAGGCNNVTYIVTQGFGGRKLNYLPTDNRIFFGGGGGAGDAELYTPADQPPPGGDGGGFVYIQADRLISTGGKIRANGGTPPFITDGIDGQSGGGGGGTVLLDCGFFQNVEVEVKGGEGGSVTSDDWDPKHGPGGGGGGGAVLCSTSPTSGLKTFVEAGICGVTDNFSQHAATDGEAGVFLEKWPVFRPAQELGFFKLKNTIVSRNPCKSTYSVRFVLDSQVFPPVEIALDGAPFQTDPFFPEVPAGKAIFTFRDGCFEKDTLLQLPDFQLLRDSLVGKAELRCSVAGSIAATAVGGVPPYQFNLGNGWAGTSTFTDLTPGTYTLQTRDAEGCLLAKTVEILDLSGKIQLEVDSSRLVSKCGGQRVFLSLSASGTEPFYSFVLDSTPPTLDGFFEKISTGKHSIFAQDDYGCRSDTLIFNILDETEVITTQVDTTICFGEIFQFLGKTYAQSGHFADTLLRPLDCDSIFKINLKIRPLAAENLAVKICRNETFELNGKQFSETGIFTEKMQTPQGCDSTVTLDLTVLDTFLIFRIFHFCPGDSMLADEFLFDSVGIYPQVLKNVLGCDSTITRVVELSLSDTCRSTACRMFIPSSFSPNGDGTNDELEVFTPVVQVFDFQVFDRWGNMIFQQKNQQPPRWDGRTARGKAALPGLYVCLVRGLCADGKEVVVWKDVALLR